MDGNEGDEVSRPGRPRGEIPLSEIPLSEILGALELPPDVLARWFDHLDAFFARHGGARRYGALAALIAEARAAQGPAARGSRAQETG